MRAKRDWKVFYTVQHVVLKLKNPFFFFNCSVRCLLMWCSSVHYARMPIKYLFTQDKFYFIFMMRDFTRGTVPFEMEGSVLLLSASHFMKIDLLIFFKRICLYFVCWRCITRIMVYVFCCMSVQLSEVKQISGPCSNFLS